MITISEFKNYPPKERELIFDVMTRHLQSLVKNYFEFKDLMEARSAKDVLPEIKYKRECISILEKNSSGATAPDIVKQLIEQYDLRLNPVERRNLTVKISATLLSLHSATVILRNKSEGGMWKYSLPGYDQSGNLEYFSMQEAG